ncbi:hypothetical protein B0H34DRAFT_685994 [Crassisporium funariophilum]|nr:hypothetical protein B0H34DRAFT_685994 [Crassisporium funariophilum]
MHSCPISKLPVELLAVVLSMLVDEHDHDRTCAEQRKQEGNSLISASEVSKHWHGVAVSCFKEWGRLIDMNHSPHWIEELVKRSRSAPLIIHFYERDEDNLQDLIAQKKWTTILAQQHRFEVFHATVCKSFGTTLLINALHKPALLLKSFSFRVRVQPLYDNTAVYPVHSVYTMLGRLFAGVAPLLRNVYLEDCTIPSEFFSGLNLTSLVVDNLVSDVALSVAWWLKLLAGQHFLEKLVIIDSISDREDNGPTSPSSPVQLSKLIHLGIQNYGTDSCAQLLEQLELPPTCTIDIEVSVCPDPVHANRDLGNALRKHLEGWKTVDAPCDYWEISYNIGNYSFEIFAFDKIEEFGCKMTRRRFGFQYKGCNEPSGWFLPISLILGELCSLDRATKLFLDLNLKHVRPNELVHVLDFLFQFKHVTDLYLTPAAVDTVLPHLQNKRARGLSSTTNPLGTEAEHDFPFLKFITLDMPSSFEAQDTRIALVYYLIWRRSWERLSCTVRVKEI